MNPRVNDDFPVWLQDIDATLPVTASYVVHGNIHDLYLVPSENGPLVPMELSGALWTALQRSGYEALVVHTPLGQRVYPPEAQNLAASCLQMRPHELNEPAGTDRLGAMIAALTGPQEHRIALVIDYVSQRRIQGQPPAQVEHDMMARALVHFNAAQPRSIGEVRPTPLHNPVFWLVEQPADLPAWLVSGSDAIRQISIPIPDITARTMLTRGLVTGSMSSDGDDPLADSPAVRFGERTEGMTLRSLIEIWRLRADLQIPPERIEDAVRAYRTGLVKNPWAQAEVRQRLRSGEQILTRRVRGQDRAVRHALDILIRSNMNMSGAERGGNNTGPRGILFFAGPTGVGKTELAKAMTALIFGDERAYIRFDMSEFASEHAEARLIGSPPGYVGHGQGGELTNAVRQRPFALVLFDEIEKAHPRILDKFLQILSDGRLTDGSGDTVHFGEALVVFTSNLGVPPLQEGAPIPRGAELESLVKTEIELAFKEQLHRPELLGRIGEDNIVVFDYIDPTTAVELATMFMNNAIKHVEKQHDVRLTLAPEVEAQVVTLATEDLSLGGRGISRVIEAVFVNPLARALFMDNSGARALTIATMTLEERGWWTLTLRP